MFPVTPSDIKLLIKEAKEAGKDTRELERVISEKRGKNQGKIKHFVEKKRGQIFYSTGPVKTKDFE